MKKKTKELDCRETFYKEFGYLETPIDFYTNSAYANPKMKGIEHLDKLADFIQSLLTQQRTEILEEIKNHTFVIPQGHATRGFKLDDKDLDFIKKL